MMQSLTFDDVARSRLVSGNRHLMVHTRRDQVRYWRDLAAVTARAANLQPVRGLARIVVTLHWPDKVRRDPCNFYPYVAKPIVDGLVDAGVLTDDDDKHVIGPDLRGVRSDAWRVVVVITPAEEWGA